MVEAAWSKLIQPTLFFQVSFPSASTQARTRLLISRHWPDLIWPKKGIWITLSLWKLCIWYFLNLAFCFPQKMHFSAILFLLNFGTFWLIPHKKSGSADYKFAVLTKFPAERRKKPPWHKAEFQQFSVPNESEVVKTENLHSWVSVKEFQFELRVSSLDKTT